MFTRDFKKLHIVLTSLVGVLLVYVGLNFCLLYLAHWAERSANTYPYKYQDWLRYLLPTMINTGGQNKLFLLGESAVREAFLYEQFNREFPSMTTFQGSLSLGTLDDTLLVLDYVKCVYGDEALPKILVLGISPRFVANIPKNSSPFIMALNRYSPFYCVGQTSTGSYLIPKGRWECLVSRARFQRKQQSRYLTAFSALLFRLLDDGLPYESFIHEFPKIRALRSALTMRSLNSLSPAIDYVRDIGVGTSVGRWLRIKTSPYKYHHLVPRRPENMVKWLLHPESFWAEVYAWDPQISESTLRFQFERLLTFTSKHGIQLYVVNLPENKLGRDLYDPINYQNYHNLVLDSLDNVPFLDLREMLSERDFYDVVHTNLPGALRVTDKVVQFIKNHQNDSHKTSQMGSIERSIENGSKTKLTVN
ncbi:MAG: hypothetical protein FVQ84_22655 [Planctomycetes bacterium]|nr:hypothetical protein [Planctomycetota bacterium]